MRLISKEVFLPTENGRPVMPGFITYLDTEGRVILHRYARQDYSDAYDDYVDIVSRDNGRTWSEPDPDPGRPPLRRCHELLCSA